MKVAWGLLAADLSLLYRMESISEADVVEWLETDNVKHHIEAIHNKEVNVYYLLEL